MTKDEARELLKIFYADKKEPPRVDERAVIRVFLSTQRDGSRSRYGRSSSGTENLWR